MKLIIFILILSLSLLSAIPGYASSKSNDDSGGSSVLTTAVLGGLLGGGLGAAIGSASGRAGTGAAIGAGVGAVGGALVGANEDKRKHQEEDSYAQPAPQQEVYSQPEVPQNAKIKKKVIRQYDQEGNVISEKEVKQ